MNPQEHFDRLQDENEDLRYQIRGLKRQLEQEQNLNEELRTCCDYERAAVERCGRFITAAQRLADQLRKLSNEHFMVFTFELKNLLHEYDKP